jgi:hypothetical protein
MFSNSPPSARIVGRNQVVVDGKRTFLAGCTTSACERPCVRKHPLLLCDGPLHVEDWPRCHHCFTPVPDRADSL